jgi:isoleucyl-tRNA synthetase
LVKPLSEKSDNAKATDIEGLFVEVTATTAAKCDRCWHHTEDVGTIVGHETICGRCVTNITGDGEVRQFA